MSLPRRDIIATGLVAAAAVLYVLWAGEATLPGMSATRVTGLAVLALGFAASASAVVPAFDQLLHGNKVYLAGTSLLGLVATIAGAHMLVTGSGASLTVVMVAMVVMWVAATVRHTLVASREPHDETRRAVTEDRHLTSR